LKKNLLGDEGAQIIADSVAKSHCIVHLDISSNNISSNGTKKVFKALSGNDSLIALAVGSVDNVQKNKIGIPSVMKLIGYLKAN
jgi:predicted RNase H-related nuclease YkuK (DUF458 family)